MLYKFKTHYLLIIILLFSLFTRVFRLSTPTTYYFDEVYHAYTAKAYARNDPKGYEWWNVGEEEGTAFEWLHPPVSKLIMASSIKIFGENSFAWRLPSAIFGTLTIYLVYLFALGLFKKKNIALLAAAIASLDGLLLVQSRIAMNDIFLVVFILLTLIYYQKFASKRNNRHLFLSGLFMGLSISTKWSGLFLLPIIGISEGFRIALNKEKISVKKCIILTTSYTLLPLIIYLLSYSQFFLQGHTTTQFVELHNQIFRYQFGLDASHPYQSRAWQWPIVAKPVWYHVDYSQPPLMGNIYALSNPIISWFGLFSFFWFIINALKNKKFTPDFALLTSSYALVWMPWILSPRIMFYYHYTPAIPFLAILIAFTLSSIKKSHRNIAILSFMTLTLLLFILFFPQWTGIPMPTWYQELVQWLPSWK